MMRIALLGTFTLLASLCLSTSVKASSSTDNWHFSNNNNISSTVVAAASDWQDFSSTAGNFTIQMPGKPQEETQKDREIGTVYYSYKVESPDGFYFVQYWDVSGANALSTKEINAVLDNSPNVFVKAAEAKLLETHNIAIDQHPGREFSFVFNNGLNGTGRVYLVQERMYIVVVVTPEQDNVLKFLDSFNLTTKPLPPRTLREQNLNRERETGRGERN